jgi:hypothetical protein
MMMERQQNQKQQANGGNTQMCVWLVDGMEGRCKSCEAETNKKKKQQ